MVIYKIFNGWKMIYLIKRVSDSKSIFIFIFLCLYNIDVGYTIIA